MRSKRSYLLRAHYEWILDSGCTPILVVNAYHPDIHVPSAFLEGDEILFNISPDAIRDLHISNHKLEFRASFSGIIHFISISLQAVLGIYAQEEEDQGCFFEFTEEESEVMDSPPRIAKLQGIDGSIDVLTNNNTLTETNKRKPILKLVE